MFRFARSGEFSTQFNAINVDKFHFSHPRISNLTFISAIGILNAVCSRSIARQRLLPAKPIANESTRQFTALIPTSRKPGLNLTDLTKNLALATNVQSKIGLSAAGVPIRTLIVCGRRKGKRASVAAVYNRFKRLNWGGWIRTRCGRHKKMHKKSPNLKHRLRQHVLVNATQSYLLDKMVTKFWKRPKYYVDDPYEPYHERSYYFASRKPMPYPDQPLKKRMSLAQLSKLYDD